MNEFYTLYQLLNCKGAKIETFLDIGVRKESRNVKLHNPSIVTISQCSYPIYCHQMYFFHCWNIRQHLCHHLQWLLQSFKDLHRVILQ